MARWTRSGPAQLGLFAAAGVVLLTLVMTVFFLTQDSALGAILSVVLGTHFLVLGALWFAYRASMRSKQTNRGLREQHKEIQSLRQEVTGLRHEIAAVKEQESDWHELTRKRLREKHNSLQRNDSATAKTLDRLNRRTTELFQELAEVKEQDARWHELTRKRIREKHNSVSRILKKNNLLHELTRKRLREKHNSLHRLVSKRAEKIENLQQELNRRVDPPAAAAQPKDDSSASQRHQVALRNVLFELLEARSTGASK